MSIPLITLIKYGITFNLVGSTWDGDEFGASSHVLRLIEDGTYQLSQQHHNFLTKIAWAGPISFVYLLGYYYSTVAYPLLNKTVDSRHTIPPPPPPHQKKMYHLNVFSDF